MHAELFLKQFGHLAQGEGGIKKLRDLIYVLASKGELTKSEVNTRRASLSQISEFIMGQAPAGTSYNDRGEGTVFVKVGEFGSRYPRQEVWTTKPQKFAQQGDVLICVVGATIGKLNLAIDCAIGRSVAAIRPSTEVDSVYLYYSLMPYSLKLRAGAQGSAQGVISRKHLSEMIIRLPSLAEQKRIVAKVDELMAVCDALEAAQNRQRTLKQQAVAATLHHLTSPATPADGGAALTILTRQFPEWFDDRTTLKTLRATILQLAVQGKLVPQDPSDEPASELLKRIETEKKRLVKEGKIKNLKPLPAISENEMFVEIGNNWCWTRLSEVYDVRDGTHDTPKYTANGFPLITSKNIYSGKLDFSDIKYISPDDHMDISKRSKVDKGNILFAMIGSIGNPVIVDTDREFSIKNVALFKPFDSTLMSLPYLQIFLQSAVQKMKEQSAGGVQSFVSLGYLRAFVIPLPPLAEQHRIVAKVDELMTLCDQLEAQLTTTQTLNAALMDALLHHLCGGAENTLNNKEAA